MLKAKVKVIREASSGRSFKFETIIKMAGVSITKVFYVKKTAISTDISHINSLLISQENIEESGVTWLKKLTNEDLTLSKLRIDPIAYVKRIPPHFSKTKKKQPKE